MNKISIWYKIYKIINGKKSRGKNKKIRNGFLF